MKPDARPDAPRVALLSVGVGRVQRGFERYFSDLFTVLSGRLDVTLLKSRGARSPQQRIPPLLGPATAIARALPLARMRGDSEYRRDCLAFAACLLPQLIGGRFDVVHCIDPPLATFLQHLRRALGFRARLLFTEGTVMPAQYYPRVSHIHHVAQVAFDQAVEHGVAATHMTMVPCGLQVRDFMDCASRQALRRKYQVGQDTFVIVVISALNRAHKRVDYVIEEVSRLKGDVLLWLDGNPEDAQLAVLARERLGTRVRITHVASADVRELYRLADVLVQASLAESFGLALAEAMCSGLMVLAHDTPHFEWLLGRRECLVDMRTPGALAGRLGQLVARDAPTQSVTEALAMSARARFDWANLAPAYVEMYRKVAALSGFPARPAAVRA
jgi:glycosyltransferase involved in cell wall biosynthesis